MYFDADETLKLAIKTVALREGRSASAIIEEILKREFPDEVKEAEKVLKAREKHKSKPSD